MAGDVQSENSKRVRRRVCFAFGAVLALMSHLFLSAHLVRAAAFDREEIHGIPFVRIPAGRFVMGATQENQLLLEEKGWWNRFLSVEQPAHLVVIRRPFWIGQTEVTQAQWKRVMGKSHAQVSFEGGDRPVDSVSYRDVQQFLKAINQLGTRRFRLPTEAEWEYCCRAGGWGLFLVGEGGGLVEDKTLGDYCWMKNNSGGGTQPVAAKKPNAWGLHDMLGNVWEWCGDFYGREVYRHRRNGAMDPIHQATFPERVIRGGSWFLPIEYQRASLRSGMREEERSAYLGFRLVCEIPNGEVEEKESSPDDDAKL